MAYIYIIFEGRHLPEIKREDILVGNFKYGPTIKIGYSTSLDRRFESYNTHASNFDILFTYDNATEEDEKRLHRYFKNYQDESQKGREWFLWDIEIMKFFEEHKTIEEIRASIPELKTKKPDKLVKKNKSIIIPVIYIMVNNGIGYRKEEFKEKSESSIIISLLNKYITETQYYKDTGEFMEFLKSNGDIGEDEFDLISNKLKEYDQIKGELGKFNSIPFYHDKMRYVCELGKKLEESKFNLFLNSIPISFKNYYTILGPEKCKAAKYRKGDMERAYQILLANQDIDVKSKIIGHFEVGKRYSNTYIKGQLGVIYNSCGYKKCPKATDIKEYFKVTVCRIPNPETGKRDLGFELVSRIQEID